MIGCYKTSIVYALTAAAVLWLTGCVAPVERRIRADQERFDSYPADIQENIRAGRIEPGYTREMVRLALGRPARIFTRTTEKEIREIWVYTYLHPRFSVGVGGTVGRGRTMVGTGMDISRDYYPEEAMRVIFLENQVYAVEKQERP